MTPRVLVFAASTRAASYNRKLAQVAADTARAEGAAVTHVELSDFDIPMYDADLEARGTPPDVLRFKQLAWAHDGWIVCSPEYNASYPGLLKNLLDWLSSPVKGDAVWADGMRSSRGKVVGILTASPGGLGGIRAQNEIAMLLLNLECWVAPNRFGLARAGAAFDDAGALVDEAARAGVHKVVLQVLQAGRPAETGPGSD